MAAGNVVGAVSDHSNTHLRNGVTLGAILTGLVTALGRQLLLDNLGSGISRLLGRLMATRCMRRCAGRSGDEPAAFFGPCLPASTVVSPLGTGRFQ